MAFSHALGRVMSAILLTILWIIGFGLYAVIAKVIRACRREPPRDSYWIDCEPTTAETMRRPF